MNTSILIHLSIWFTLTVNVVSAVDCVITSYRLPSGSTEPAAIAFSPNGSYLATANAYDVTIFTSAQGVLNQGTSYSSSRSADSRAIAFSPNGMYLAIVNYISNTVTIFTSTSGVLNEGTSYSLPGGSNSSTSIAFSPDGSYLAVCNYGSADVTIFTVRVL